MTRPLIALLTDFGLRDHYVGVMKGVVLGICPDAQLVDLSHDVPPQDVVRGMSMLDAAARFFPPGTIFLCVIDPGVGSSRRAVAVEADAYRFVGPDNGLFSRVYRAAAHRRAVELASAEHMLPRISRTFEGRDRFAPAAAWLARGLPLETLGPGVDALVSIAQPAVRVQNGVVTGEVIAADRFGNLFTNVDRDTFERVVPPREVQIAGHRIARIVETYADASAGELCALVSSNEQLEIAVAGGSAAARIGADVGAAVQVRSIA